MQCSLCIPELPKKNFSTLWKDTSSPNVSSWDATKRNSPDETHILGMSREMESYLSPYHYDLVTPDGYIADLKSIDPKRKLATVKIENIFPGFVGYEIEPNLVFFNLKSTLAQVGIEGIGKAYHYDRKESTAEVQVELTAYGELASAMLELLPKGAFIGKLFAADERRRVRDPDYLLRMATRSD